MLQQLATVDKFYTKTLYRLQRFPLPAVIDYLYSLFPLLSLFGFGEKFFLDSVSFPFFFWREIFSNFDSMIQDHVRSVT